MFGYDVLPVVAGAPSASGPAIKAHGNFTKKPSLGYVVKVGEGSINDHHIDHLAQVRGGNTAKRAAINSNVTSHPDISPEIPQDCLGISPEVARCRSIFEIVKLRLWFGKPIASVIPNQNINAFLQEIPEIKGMREVDHVLIEHCIWVAQNKSGLVFVQFTGICIVDRLTGGREEHGVD